MLLFVNFYTLRPISLNSDSSFFYVQLSEAVINACYADIYAQ